MKFGTRRDFLMNGGVALTGMTAAASGLMAISKPLDSEEIPAKTAAANSRLRGLMVDAARVPEKLDYYRRVIDFCAAWELNALQFRIADDQGSALRFASAPDLLFHEHAFSPEELRDLAKYAGSRGVDLIPELESFGHTGYITRSTKYAHLLDDDSAGNREFTGVIPVEPETLELFEKLYREIAAIFPSKFLHGGCDEVNWGGSQLSRRALQSKSRAQIWGEYLNSLNEISRKLNRQFIVWGDFVLHKEPEILGKLNKEIIIMDWNYVESDPAKIQAALSTVHANGSRGIGAPALINYRWGPRAGTDQLRNIDAFAGPYLAPENTGSLGVILTNWVPSRYIQNSIWDGFAYGAVAFKDGPEAARSSAFRRFVERHYGAKWNNNWQEAFRLIYDLAPQMHEKKSTTGAPPLHIPWSNDQELASVLKNRPLRENPFTRLRALLVQLKPQVPKNLADFQAFALSVEYLEKLYWREAIVTEHAAGKQLTREESDLLIQRIATSDHAMAEALTREWDKGRFSDSAAKVKPLFGFDPKDQLLFQWTRATEYSASLASHLGRFYNLLTGGGAPSTR
jgi:hypothetical protein